MIEEAVRASPGRKGGRGGNAGKKQDGDDELFRETKGEKIYLIKIWKRATKR